METLSSFQRIWSDWTAPVLYLLLPIVIVYITWTYLQLGLARVPGPPLASVLPIWRLFAVWKEDMPRMNNALHRKYGPVVRIGPKHVSVSSPEAFHLVYGSKSTFMKSPIYAVGQPRLDGQPLPNLFSLRNRETHALLKRTIGSIYTVTALSDLEFHIDRCINTLIAKLKHMTQNKPASVDISAWMQYFSFDSIGEINFSRNLGFLDTGSDVNGIISAADKRMRYFALAGQCPSVDTIISKLRRVRGKSNPNPLLDFASKAVHERIEHSQNPDDILTRLLKMHQANPDRLSLKEVTATAYINVVAGHDVLAITLRAILYHLCRSPRARQTFLDEIIDASKYFSTPVRYSEVSNLPYLSAVIHEALRIHPNTGLILERCVPVGGATIHGMTLAEGTIIGANAWVIHQNKEIFGEDVDAFKPERWINSPPAQISEMHRNLFTFGAGPRACIGRNLAMMQISKLIVELYRNFHIELNEPGKEWRVTGGWITKQVNMDMILTQRILSSRDCKIVDGAAYPEKTTD